MVSASEHAGHPLDPLSEEEVRRAAAAIRAAAGEKGVLDFLRFNSISLKEPSKADLLAHKAGGAPLAREAEVVLQALPKTPIVEAVVSLGAPKASVKEWREVGGKHGLPMLTPDDCTEAEEIVKADAEVQRLLRARGITDPACVACDPWSVHAAPVGGRLIQTFMYRRSSPCDNHYAHPLDFLPVVNLTDRKVVRIDQPYKEAPPLPELDINYHHTLLEGAPRATLKPLNILQPEGPSFKVTGRLLEWERWSLRLGFNYREGLTLHDVAYQDGGRARPILHRLSLVEMAVPYGDPHEPFPRKCAFDVSDYGLGFCANSLALGCDCLGHIQYFDAVLSDTKGEPWVIKKAVCLHEEDAGIMWKHMEYRTGDAEVRRSRRLVLSFVSTVVNYEYAFYYYFYQDGSIEYQIKLTGELSTNLPSPGEDWEHPKFGVLVAKGVNAQVHQHQFCARLDFAVDDAEGGKALQVSEVNVEALPEGPENPYGNAFVAVETPFGREQEAIRVANPASARVWKVSNPQSLHPTTGKPVAYKLMPAASPLLLAQPTSLLQKRGGFAAKNLWVTPHSEAEKWPAGEYTIQSQGGEGLPQWTQQDRPIGSGSDPVVWYSFGVTHVPRPEDFPVMNCETVGYMLKPVGFFRYNPAIDLPAGPNAASQEQAGCCNGAAYQPSATTLAAEKHLSAPHTNGVHHPEGNGFLPHANGNGVAAH